ncbi:MAG: hypothetical protein HY815_15195 [Candidatus Riflebacteria bacterium]|nr:hypothetical protein [Candidatus Riflebacteria bacterium]
MSFPESVVASLTADRVLTIQGPYGRMALRAVPAPLIAVLRRLTHPGEELGRLVEAARLTSPPGSPALPELSRAVPDGPALLAQLFHTLQHLAGQGFLTLRVVAGGTPLATLVPMGPSFVLSRDHRIEGPLILSRFAYIHREAQETLLESPLAFARVTLHDGRAAAVTHALMVPTLPTSIPDRVPGLSPETVTQLVCLLGYAGMLSPVGPDGKPHEDENPRLATWEFHDLLFHARSREGRHDAPSGNTYRFLGRLPCPPAVKTVAGVEQIELHRPDLPGLEQHDPPVATAMERRRSIRERAAPTWPPVSTTTIRSVTGSGASPGSRRT